MIHPTSHLIGAHTKTPLRDLPVVHTKFRFVTTIESIVDAFETAFITRSGRSTLPKFHPTKDPSSELA
jgi:hypothetical protein